MHFSLTSCLVAAMALALPLPIYAILTPDALLADIAALSDQVKGLGASALQINRFAAIQYQFGQSGPFIDFFAKLDALTSTIKSDINDIQFTGQFSDADALRVSAAFTEHIGFQALFISIVVSKAPELAFFKDINQQIVDKLTDTGGQLQKLGESVAQVIPTKVAQLTSVLQPFLTFLGLSVRVYVGVQF